MMYVNLKTRNGATSDTQSSRNHRPASAPCAISDNTRQSPTAPQESQPAGPPPPRLPITPQLHHSITPFPHTLRHCHGYWFLIFEGHDTILKHEQALYYVAWLLAHPHIEPIHALDLAARATPNNRRVSGIDQVVDLVTGRPVALDAGASISQLNLNLDEARAMRAVLRQQSELEALLDDADLIEPVKAEVERELTALYEYEKKHTGRIRDTAAKAADAVGRAFHRLCRHLACASLADGTPNPVLRGFGEHLQQYILIPSGRGSTRGGYRCRHLAGRFTYQPPAGTIWSIH